LLASRGAGKLEKARESIIEELQNVGYPEPEERIHILAGIDVADEGALERLHEHAVELFGDVDLLIINAGISGAEEMVADMTLEAWNRTMEANLISNYSLLRKFGPAMKRRRGSQVLNVSSYFGGEKYVAVAYPNRADYAVSKAGQRALAEILSRHLGPEIQINALAPGPVDGERLRGTETSPGLFARRGKLILGNKRLNDIHAAVLAALAEGVEVKTIFERFSSNKVEDLTSWGEGPKSLRALGERFAKGRKGGSSTSYVFDAGIAEKLVARVENGGLVEDRTVTERFLAGMDAPPEPFFDQADVQVQRDKVEQGILNLLHLHRMPTDEQVALSTVFYLADPNVSGETFHPSGGLKFDRSVTEGELVGRPGPMQLAKLAEGNVVIMGEAQKEEVALLAQTFGEIGVERIRVLVRSHEVADELEKRLAQQVGEANLRVMAIGDDLEGALAHVRSELGRIDVVVSTPFDRLPLKPLAGEPGRSWERVLSRDDFAEVVHQQLTHHFRIARVTSLWEGCRLVLVTPDTSRASTREEFALGMFCKTSLHAFTVTVGVEGERLPTAPAINQVQLTRRSRAEEPATDKEQQEELARFVDAVLQCSLPAPSSAESRYLARIYRGNAVTV
ncbi:MAG: SDR family oxidoreductase, partial [Myxococcota bacterium]